MQNKVGSKRSISKRPIINDKLHLNLKRNFQNSNCCFESCIL